MKVLLILISVLLVNVVFAQKRYQRFVETEYRGDTVVLISTKEPVTGIVYLENKEDGFLMEEQYVNGVNDGYAVTTKNGMKIAEYNFKNGKSHGVYRTWNENGNLEVETNWVNGLSNGKFKYFYENGNLKIEGIDSMGKLNGKHTEYYESGKMKKTEFWKDGLLEGPSITFSENASNGLFTSKISYKAGKRHGKCQWFFEKSVLPGQLRCEANYENGEQHGLTTWWYDNGQILSKEKFVNGKFHGVKKAWYSNGKIATIEKWKDGKQVFDKNWDKDGNKLNQDFPITPPIGILKD
jgi:antitoxin component YwqK of YwqJK toxin-antitoxin module